MVSGKSFTVATKGFCDIIDITDQVSQIVSDSGIGNGIVTVFTPGSTAAVTTIEYEPGVVSDLKAAIERMAPQDIHYNHDARWGDGNGFSHIRAALIGPSLTVPIIGGRLDLGTWQQVTLLDFDNRGRNRKVTVQIVGE